MAATACSSVWLSRLEGLQGAPEHFGVRLLGIDNLQDRHKIGALKTQEENGTGILHSDVDWEELCSGHTVQDTV